MILSKILWLVICATLRNNSKQANTITAGAVNFSDDPNKVTNALFENYNHSYHNKSSSWCWVESVALKAPAISGGTWPPQVKPQPVHMLCAELCRVPLTQQQDPSPTSGIWRLPFIFVYTNQHSAGIVVYITSATFTFLEMSRYCFRLGPHVSPTIFFFDFTLILNWTQDRDMPR